MRRHTIEIGAGRRVPIAAAVPSGFRPGTHPAVILAPGAGSDMAHPFLLAMQHDLAEAGWVAVTFDFPYRAAGRRAPDPMPVLERAWRGVLAHVRGGPDFAPPWVAIGGRSMGGRVASHLAAAREPGVGALVLLAYPLHPPGRPDQLRVEHLASVEVPTLVVQGTRDALARVTLLRTHAARLPRVTLHLLDGADHGFHVPRRSGRRDADVQDEVLATVLRFLAAARSQDPPIACR